MKLQNKVAIITGSSKGIGYEIAKAFVINGAKVVICGSSEDSANNAKEKILNEFPNADILSQKVDVTNTNDVIKLFKITYEKWGKIDILINNAGVAPRKAIDEMSDEDFESVLNINTFGTFKCTREAVKYMKDNGGSIINTSSFVSIYGSPNQSAYSASKAAINGLTKSNAKELGKYQIRVNAVAPGVVMTQMVKETCDPNIIAHLNMMTPLQRGAEPKDLVGIYLYLASDDSKFTTGTIINVDGGLVM